MNMSRLSVPEAAARLGVSPARVRQRIADGSLVAEKIGGRWLVDLSVSQVGQRRGRPVKADVVWDAISLAAQAPGREGAASVFSETLFSAFSQQDNAIESSLSSRRRALQRLTEAASAARMGGDESGAVESLLAWLGNRAERRLYRVADRDFQPLSEDPRLIASGVSHPQSGMQDPRIVEGYIAADDLEGLMADHWLDPIGVDQKPNVILHVAPARPHEVSALMLAADLAEQGGPREVQRAHELVAEALT
jgi:excisionase family DNA binding protein